MAYSREIEKLERQFAENPRRFAAPFADALRKSADVPRALEVIQVGLELNPDYIPASVILGRCHLDLGDDLGAEAAFSRVLDLDKENVIALKSLADIMERQERHEEAVSFLTYLLEVDRSNDEAREQLARLEARPAAPPPAREEPRPQAVEAPEPRVAEPPVAEAPSPDLTEFVEPTALWEPPVDAAEAPISSWVEPTAVDPPAEVDAPPSILEDDRGAEEVTPLDGLEGVAMEGADDLAAGSFFVEREEEIVLTGSLGTDYQVRNDAEDLLEHALEGVQETNLDDGEESPAEEESPTAVEADFEEHLAFSTEPDGTDGATRMDESDAVTLPPVIESEEGQAPIDEADAPEEEPGLDPGPSALEDEAPLEWAMHIGEQREFVPAHLHTGVHPPDSFDAAIEGIAPVDEDAQGEDEETSGAGEETEVDGDQLLVVTESMAELYASQGHAGEALGVYRILYDRNPDNERLRLRIQDLEAALAAEAGANATPSYAASVTGGRAVTAFLGAMLGARPAHVETPVPPAPPEAAPLEDSAEESPEEAVASGAPTRPAVDRLSLGAVFGEDPSPVPPAENAGAPDKADSAPGFSFDDFFGGGAAPGGKAPAASARASRAGDTEDDLDQFHVWLQSLKR